MSGLGTDSVRWIPCDSRQRMDVSALGQQIERGPGARGQPFLVVGTAGRSARARSTRWRKSPGCAANRALVPCRRRLRRVGGQCSGGSRGLAWTGAGRFRRGGPHKWLYAPLEAGCVLVRNPRHLLDAFSYQPPYYNFDADAINYFDFGPQNSRGFRALKIWMAFQQAGRAGFCRRSPTTCVWPGMPSKLFGAHPEFEAVTQNLSICTFRYVPAACVRQYRIGGDRSASEPAEPGTAESGRD